MTILNSKQQRAKDAAVATIAGQNLYYNWRKRMNGSDKKTQSWIGKLPLLH